MKKASKPTGTKKPVAKRPIQKQPPAKPAKSKKAQGGAELTEAVAQLAQSAEKIAQAADRLAEATAWLSVPAQTQHEIPETPDPSTHGPTESPQEFEAQAQATDDEE